jgi:hypothetical protein
VGQHGGNDALLLYIRSSVIFMQGWLTRGVRMRRPGVGREFSGLE